MKTLALIFLTLHTRRINKYSRHDFLLAVTSQIITSTCLKVVSLRQHCIVFHFSNLNYSLKICSQAGYNTNILHVNWERLKTSVTFSNYNIAATKYISQATTYYMNLLPYVAGWILVK